MKKTLLGAPGITTRSKDATIGTIGAPGIATGAASRTKTEIPSPPYAGQQPWYSLGPLRSQKDYTSAAAHLRSRCGGASADGGFVCVCVFFLDFLISKNDSFLDFWNSKKLIFWGFPESEKVDFLDFLNSKKSTFLISRTPKNRFS